MSLLMLLDSASSAAAEVPAGVIGLTSPATTPYTRSDFSAKQGDTAVTFADALTYSNDDEADLTGANVEFVMRSLTSGAPLSITGTVTVTIAAQGLVQFTPAAGDTDIPGEYMQNWRVTFASGLVMDFPTVGYNTVTIEENLTTAGGEQLVSVPDVKEYIGMVASDHAYDAKLARLIRAARPVIENITGPIIPAVFQEWHDGGSATIQIRSRPSTKLTTTPILSFSGTVDGVTLGVDEYWGTVKHSLSVAGTPSSASSFSCMADEIGTITRLTSGGAGTPFYGRVHVAYRAGQSGIPPNVYEAVLELMRVNYQTTMAAGRGRLTVSDDQDTGPPLGFFVPRRVLQMLGVRRAPSVA